MLGKPPRQTGSTRSDQTDRSHGEDDARSSQEAHPSRQAGGPGARSAGFSRRYDIDLEFEARCRAEHGCQRLPLKVFLAGRVAVETDGFVIEEARFPGRQGRLLFAYLAVEQGRPVPRDELAEALWEEARPATWDKAVSLLVSKLRNLLTSDGIDGASVLTNAFGCYQLDLPEGSRVDVIVAAEAAQEAEEALAAGALEKAKTAARLVESLLRQPFLPGEEGSWVAGSGVSSPMSAAAR